MIKKLTTLGFSEEELTKRISLTTAVLEFINNSSREEFTNLLSVEFDNLSLVILKLVFRGDINHFDILLNEVVDWMNSEERCEIILDLLERMLLSKHAEVLCVFTSEVNSVIEKMECVSSSSERLGTAVRFLAALKRKSDRGIGTPRHISLTLLRRTRCWRNYSLDQLQYLKDNENVRSWHLAEVVLDWIEQKEPWRETIYDLRSLVLGTIDADVNKSPYPQYYRYRYEIDAEFKRLCQRAGSDRSVLQRILDFLRPAVGYVFSNLNSILLFTGIVWFWLVEPSDSLLTVNGGRAIFALFVVNYFKVLCFGAAQFIFKWNVKISVCKEGIKKLANSYEVPVKLKAYSSEGSVIRLLPYFYRDVQLVNYSGMGYFKIRNTYWSKDYHIKHWYMKAYFDGVEKPFYSVFTHSHREIVDFLNKRYEQSPKGYFNRFLRSLVYYLFGWAPISICSLNYD